MIGVQKRVGSATRGTDRDKGLEHARISGGNGLMVGGVTDRMSGSEDSHGYLKKGEKNTRERVTDGSLVAMFSRCRRLKTE